VNLYAWFAVGRVDPRDLLLRCRRSVCCCLLGLDRGLLDDIGLVDRALDDLLLLGIEVLCEVLVEGGLLLLETCLLLANTRF
jgi:hypothetical protein